MLALARLEPTLFRNRGAWAMPDGALVVADPSPEGLAVASHLLGDGPDGGPWRVVRLRVLDHNPDGTLRHVRGATGRSGQRSNFLGKGASGKPGVIQTAFGTEVSVALFGAPPYAAAPLARSSS